MLWIAKIAVAVGILLLTIAVAWRRLNDHTTTPPDKRQSTAPR